MKRFFLSIAALVSAFFVGLGIFVFIFLYFTSIPEIASPNYLSIQKKEDCIESKSFPGISQKISELKKGKSGYFSQEKFSGNWEKRSNFINDWYGKHLKAMDEKSLLDATDENTEVYRFLWLRTFHHPIFVRVESNQNKIRLFTKELDGAGGYEPGKVLRSNEIALKQEDFCKFLDLLEKTNFWKMKTNNEVLGNDGAEWILEGVKKGRYHVVDRWSPDKGEYREACIFLLKISGVDLDTLKDDLY